MEEGFYIEFLNDQSKEMIQRQKEIEQVNSDLSLQLCSTLK